MCFGIGSFIKLFSLLPSKAEVDSGGLPKAKRGFRENLVSFFSVPESQICVVVRPSVHDGIGPGWLVPFCYESLRGLVSFVVVVERVGVGDTF